MVMSFRGPFFAITDPKQTGKAGKNSSLFSQTELKKVREILDNFFMVFEKSLEVTVAILSSEKYESTSGHLRL